MKDCLNWSDYALLLGLTLAVTLIGMLLPRITKLLTGFVFRDMTLDEQRSPDGRGAKPRG